MKSPTPSLLAVARVLVARQRSSDASPFSALEKTRVYLSKLLGVNGYRTMLGRAHVIARGEVRWLESTRVQTDGSIAIVEGSEEDPDQATIAGEVLLANLLELLRVFIGRDLTVHLLREIWPDVSLNDLDFGPEESSS